jgi:hypothetical protein|nr:MAG: hypothetical protein KatS3mg041_1087 [Bacteroidota bacterium]
MSGWSTMALVLAAVLSLVAVDGARRAWARYRNGEYRLLGLLLLWGGLLLGCAFLWLGYWSMRGLP